METQFREECARLGRRGSSIFLIKGWKRTGSLPPSPVPSTPSSIFLIKGWKPVGGYLGQTRQVISSIFLIKGWKQGDDGNLKFAFFLFNLPY